MPNSNPRRASGATSPHLHLVPRRERALPAPSPLELWHLLSLDAPTVAVVWMFFVGWGAGVRISLADGAAMFLAVWILYAADRLMDARPLAAGLSGGELEDRHLFHHRHRSVFLPCMVAATVPLAYLLHRLKAPVLHLDALLAALLAGWLLLVHARPAPAAGTRLPKELAVGLFFPAAVFIPTVARAPDLRPVLLPDAALLAAICCLNCLLLYAWEHPRDRSRAHLTTRWAMQRLVSLGIAIACVSLLVGVVELRRPSSLPHPWALALSAAASAALLLGLHALRHRIRALRLRALADLVLLTPLPILLAGWWGLRR